MRAQELNEYLLRFVSGTVVATRTIAVPPEQTTDLIVRVYCSCRLSVSLMNFTET